MGSLARPGGPGKLWRQSLLNKDLAQTPQRGRESTDPVPKRADFSDTRATKKKKPPDKNRFLKNVYKTRLKIDFFKTENQWKNDLNPWIRMIFHVEFHCAIGFSISPRKWWVISIFQKKKWKIDFLKIGFLKSVFLMGF